MKKYILIFFAAISAGSQTVAQQIVFDIAKKYYRSNPFEQEFSKFLTHLMNDPTLQNKSIHKKTDSTLFFLEGTYTSHNPFFFKATETKIILAEREDVENIDSTSYLQTSYLYQLVVYADEGNEGIKDVKGEFEKFCQRYKKKFEGENYKELQTKEKQVGEIRDYSLKNPGFFPLTVAWATSKEQNDNLFALTIRFRVFNNVAYLPAAPDGL